MNKVENKKTKRLVSIWVPITLVALAVILFLLGYLIGFRITYAPELENSWDAISAVAEWIGVLVSVISVVASFVAIWYAIQVPKKIADRQDKIALFEKRYACFQFFEECFVLYKISLEKNATEKIIHRCYHILGIETSDALSQEEFHRKAKQFEYILHQIPFLFEGIDEKEIEKLYAKLSVYLYVVVFKKPVEKEKLDYICAMKTILKHNNEIWDSMTISNIE